MLNITKKPLKHIYDNTCIYADKINQHHMISRCLILLKLEVSANQSRALSYPLSIHEQLVNNATSRSSSCTNNWHFWLLQETVYESGGTNYWKGKRNVEFSAVSSLLDCFRWGGLHLASFAQSENWQTLSRVLHSKSLRKNPRHFSASHSNTVITFSSLYSLPSTLKTKPPLAFSCSLLPCCSFFHANTSSCSFTDNAGQN